MMKRWLSVALILTLLFSAVSALGEEILEEEFSEEKKPAAQWVEYNYDELTVGNPTRMNGQFLNGLCGRDTTSDDDVHNLIFGYNLVTWDGELSLFRVDHSVVSGFVAGDDQDGNRRYLMSIYQDLFYSDGTPITAWDYAFSVLLQASPLVRELGGKPADYSFLMGYDEYVSGEAAELAGLRVVGDYELVFIVKKEALPYFYELSRFSFDPYPISAIAPGCRVWDNGTGTLIGSEKGAEEASPFTAELLKKTLLDPDTGYLTNPVPCSGPYVLTSFDGLTATLEINSWYKGNEAGQKPRIPKLIYTQADDRTMIDDLGQGKFGLLNKVTQSEAIVAGLQLMNEKPQYTRSSYPRTGMTYLYFMPDDPLLQDQKVRQALAYCLDQPQFIRNYVGYYGLETYGLYGLGQWMYQIVSGTMSFPVEEKENATEAEQREYEEALAAWEELTLDNLNRYELNLETAADLLDEAGWNLNERGEPFDPAKDTVRCKLSGEELLSLQLKIGYTETNTIAEGLQEYFVNQLAQVGVQATIEAADIRELAEIFEGNKETHLDILYLGNNFEMDFDPARIFATGDTAAEPGTLPAVYAELLALAKDMDQTDPQDPLTYVQKWVRFQEKLNETLPLIPVYMNVYFDFYTSELHRYDINNYLSWAGAIVPARMSSVNEATEEEREALQQELEDAMGNSGNKLDFSFKHEASQGPDASRGALSTFPKEIQEQIPEEYRIINEFIAVSLKDNYQNVSAATIRFAFETRYKSGESVYLLFGKPEGEDVTWFVQEGTVLKNGSVSVTLQKEQLDTLAGTTFALAAVSKE